MTKEEFDNIQDSITEHKVKRYCDNCGKWVMITPKIMGESCPICSSGRVYSYET